MVTSISDALPATFIPPAPSNVKAPELVVRLLAAEASIDTPIASIVTPPEPASISIPPLTEAAQSFIASLAASVEEIFTDEPIAPISISSPAAAALAKISIPPAVASILTASAPVPVEDKRRLASFPPVKEIVRSSASASVALVNPLAYIFASPSCAAYTVVTSELPIVTVFCPLPVAPAPITVSSLTPDAEGTV